MQLEILEHYKLGIIEIDNEHLGLFTAFNDLGYKLKNNTCLIEDFTNFYNLFSLHLNNEEIYMRGIKYPYINEHLYQHIAMINCFKKSFIINPIILLHNNYSIKSLEDLLLSHIDQHDIQIGEYNKRRNLASIDII